MAGKPKETRWARGGRTEAKHRVLVECLNAWIPIFGLQHQVHELVFIDGFAGPGRHTGGELGSPLLMLEAYEKHRDRARFEVVAHFFFIEKDEDREKVLCEEIAARGELPADVSVEVICGDYAEEFSL